MALPDWTSELPKPRVSLSSRTSKDRKILSDGTFSCGCLLGSRIPKQGACALTMRAFTLPRPGMMP